MSPVEPRRQHYIPKVLLKNFLNDGGYLWIGNKHERKIYKASPTDVFVKRDLYTKYDIVRSSKSYEYEKRFSEMERIAAPVINKIIEMARNEKWSILSPDDYRIWKEFFITIARRTPESQARVSKAGDRDVFWLALKDRADKENFALGDRETLYQDPRILEIKKQVESNVDARFAVGDSDRVKKETNRFSLETGLHIARIRNPRRSFCIGSHGLSIVCASHQKDSAQVGWLSIAHDVAVSATAFPDRDLLTILDYNTTVDETIRSINFAAASQSHTIAARSEKLIKSLMRRANRET